MKEKLTVNLDYPNFHPKSPPAVVEQTIVTSVSAYLEVSNHYVQTPPNSLYILPITVTWSSYVAMLAYVFPVLSMTSCLHITPRTGDATGRIGAYSNWLCGAESDIYDYLIGMLNPNYRRCLPLPPPLLSLLFTLTVRLYDCFIQER